MKYHEVVGYVADGAIICADCATPEEARDPDGLPPVFAGEECDRSEDERSYCDRCTMPLIED